MIKISKDDRKIFRAKIAQWQENYMDKLNQEYIKILSSPDKDPSEKFWALEKRIRQDKKHPGVICDISSDIEFTILRLINDKVIDISELDDFSEEFREAIIMWLRR